jgi:hypothetical protein
VDYALGANPYGRSYLVGFGNQPFNNVHHRGAFGAWAGFEHFIKGKADDRATSRHILYGALVAGPDNNDVFLCGKDSRKWLPAGADGNDVFYQFPNRSDPVRKTGYVWNAADLPVQDVMDSQFNEVALDYNAGLTASLAWLCAHGLSSGQPLPDGEFPPKAQRNESLDPLTTDREYFVIARNIAATQDQTQLEATIWNRSRWPARVSTNLSFRYYLRLDRVRPDQVQATVTGSDKARVSPVKGLDDKTAFIEVSFPGDEIYPGNLSLASRTVKLGITAPAWNGADDWSAAGLSSEPKLLPRLPVYDLGRLVGGMEP